MDTNSAHPLIKDTITAHPSTMDTNTTDSPIWTAGDVSLVSCDGVRFRIDALHLHAASERLRDLVASAGGEVVFTATDATTLNLFLHLLVRAQLPTALLSLGVRTGSFSTPTSPLVGPVSGSPRTTLAPAPPNVDVIDRLRALLTFLKAHDCATLRSTALVNLHGDRRLRPFQRFAIGAGEDDLDLCIAALRATALDPTLGRNHDVREPRGRPIVPAGGGGGRPKPRSHSFTGEDTAGRFDLDPRAMPFRVASRIPPKYLWALTRAWDESNADIEARSGYHVDELVDAFEGFFKVAREAGPVPQYEVVEPRRRRSSSLVAMRRRSGMRY